MRKKYTGIALPHALIMRVDGLISQDKWGYTSRSEFAKEAIRKLLIDLEKK